MKYKIIFDFDDEIVEADSEREAEKIALNNLCFKCFGEYPKNNKWILTVDDFLSIFDDVIKTEVLK